MNTLAWISTCLLSLMVTIAAAQNRAIRVRAVDAIQQAGMRAECDMEEDCTFLKVQLKVPEWVYTDNLDLYRDMLSDFWKKIKKLGFRKLEARTTDFRIVFRKVEKPEE